MYKASIIVSFNNEYALTKNFLDNILSITNANIEIVGVVDGATDQNTFLYLSNLNERIDNLHIVFLENNAGYSVANNIAVTWAHAKYLIFLNSDTFPIKTAIYDMISYMDSHENVGVAQGLILYPQTNKVQSAGHIFGFYKTTHAFDGRSIDTPIVNQEAERQALGSGFYITPKALFDAEQGFDEIYYNAWEGLEYSLKMHLKGYKCMYLPHVRAYHVKGSGRSRLVRDETYQSGYFWTNWGKKILMDIPDIFTSQLAKNDFNKQYLLVNGSSIRTNIWKIMLDRIPFLFCGDYAIQKAISKSAISLEDSIPISFLQSQTHLMFVTDHFNDIRNNYRTFQLRKLYGLNDIILDLHGNVIRINDQEA